MNNTAPRESTKPLVLVVDDESTICSTLSRVLQDESFDTVVAKDGPSAVEIVAELGPDVVFLDINSQIGLNTQRISSFF